ncbi:hypothetical protein G9A89_009047 [Geosiphon pyriformis]|nr:hypothetical protein G9A89_009047 [Geosiphon pyriformis]
MLLDEFAISVKYSDLDVIFHKLKLLVFRIVKASHEENVVNFDSLIRLDSGAGSDHICFVFFGAKKSYCAAKLVESLKAKEVNIRSAIDKRMESFKINKDHMIRSVLECPFHKVVFDHLVVNDKLILESDLYVFDEVFSGVMCLIEFDELFEMVSNLSDGKAAGLSVPSSWKKAWVLMIFKPYEWESVLMNTYPIVLIEMASILNKQLLYLVSAVFHPIVGYRTQFSFVSVDMCNNNTIYYPFFYGLKSFLQVQSKSKVASLVSFINSDGVLGHLFSHRSYNLQVLCWHSDHPLSFSVHICVSASNNFLANMVCILFNCNLSLGGFLASFFWFRGGISMFAVLDKSKFLKFLFSLCQYGIVFKRLNSYGSVPKWFKISAMFLDSEASSAYSLVSSEVCPLNILNSGNFASVCNCFSQIGSDSLFVYMDKFLKNLGTVDYKAGIAAFFEDINLGLRVSILDMMLSIMAELQAIVLALKCVLLSSSVYLFSDSQSALDAYNVRFSHTNMIAGAASLSGWHFSSCLDKHFIVADGSIVSDNFRHFVHDIICFMRLTGSAHCWYDILICIWLLVLPAGSRLCLYDKCYFSVLYLYCNNVKVSDHVFFCEALFGFSYFFSSILQLLSSCVSDFSKAISIFYDPKVASLEIVKFVHFLGLTKLWHIAQQCGAMSENTAHCLAMWSDLKTEIENTTHQPTTLSLNLCSLYKRLNTKKSSNTTNISIILALKPAPTTPIQTVAESEETETNHLEFVKSLFQYYSESAFNFYVHERISYLLRVSVETNSARENFYNELIQNTSLLTNYNFTAILTEINKEIEIYTQQKYPIIYANKGKGKLQTPTKTRVESPINPSYHYTSGSAINITVHILKDLSLNCLCYQDSDLHYPNQISKPQHNQNNQNLDLINQPDLLPIIIINPPPVELIGQPLQQPHQQIQQPLVPLQQPSQSNLNPIAYALIAKLKKFTGKEDNTQVWLNNVEKAIAANEWNDARAIQAIPYFLQDTADSWYQNIVNKLQDFNAFKIEFLKYFSNNNSINRLANTFTTIKQRKNEAVTTYLGHFYRNLHQIQAINTNYFTVAQILNQFIYGLHSSILQYIHPMHSIDLQAAITNARDFEAAELKANHAQAVNLVMNRSFELDSKLKQFSDSIN